MILPSCSSLSIIVLIRPSCDLKEARHCSNNASETSPLTMVRLGESTRCKRGIIEVVSTRFSVNGGPVIPTEAAPGDGEGAFGKLGMNMAGKLGGGLAWPS